MNTPLDAHCYTRWHTELARLEFKHFLLRISHGDREVQDDVLVSFNRCHFMCAFNEFARDDEDRQGHVLCEHQDSKLMEWIDQNTTIFITETKREETSHYSVLLSDNIYHVISDEPPKVEIVQKVNKTK